VCVISTVVYSLYSMLYLTAYLIQANKKGPEGPLVLPIPENILNY